MAVTTQRFTLDDYLTYEDGTDTRYELVNGELVAMAPPKGRHGAIAEFLVEYNVLDIPEYWVVDPIEHCITLMQPVEDLYEVRRLTEEALIPSQIFPDLNLTVAEVLAAE